MGSEESNLDPFDSQQIRRQESNRFGVQSRLDHFFGLASLVKRVEPGFPPRFARAAGAALRPKSRLDP
jgi:hypothetical protein